MARPNVCVIECYFDGKPVLLIDNFEEIQEGEQLLLDYGERRWCANPVHLDSTVVRFLDARFLANR